MANQRNMAALHERLPGFGGIGGGESRRDGQRSGESGGREPTEMAQNAVVTHSTPTLLLAAKGCDEILQQGLSSGLQRIAQHNQGKQSYEPALHDLLALISHLLEASSEPRRLLSQSTSLE